MMCPLRGFHRGDDAECLEDDCGWWINGSHECGIAVLSKMAIAEFFDYQEEDEEIVLEENEKGGFVI